MGRIVFCFWGVFVLSLAYGQVFTVEYHPNNRKMAIWQDSIRLTDFRFSEVSEFSEGKAYAAEGGLYAYINEQGSNLTPFEFVVANNFKKNLAVVGDSNALGVINAQFKQIVGYHYLNIHLSESNFIMVQDDGGHWGMIDSLGKFVLDTLYDIPPKVVNDSLFIVRRDDEFGLVSRDKVLFNTSYQYITTDGFGYKSGIRLRLFHITEPD